MNKRLVAIAALLVGVGFGGAVWFFFLRGVRPDFDHVGGTILIYELVDQGDAEKVAGPLQKRLDPDERGLAVVRALDKRRVEMRIPRTSAKHAEEIARIKELVHAVGHLEILILANSTDDKLAIEHARKMLNEDADAGLKNKLREQQVNGLPPAGPYDPATMKPTIFTVNLAKGETSLVTYRWVELGPQERRTLGLDGAPDPDPQRNQVRQEARKHLGKAAAWKDPPVMNEGIMYGALFYGRECADRALPEKEQWKKVADYFVLARDPEIDPNWAADMPVEKRRTRSLDGTCLASAAVPSRRDQHWLVGVTFNAEGKELLRVLTKKNVPSQAGPGDIPLKRHLAIVLDGQVMSAPFINAEVLGGQAQITGAFSEAEARNLSAILRAGALPARLKALPMSETDVPAKVGK